jgi:hypothetical protein
MSRFSLGVGKNILLSCCTYCECLIMLFLRIGLNFNYDFHFIGELKFFEHMIISLGNLCLGTYLWHMRFYMFTLNLPQAH